jgi:hypothetical protein
MKTKKKANDRSELNLFNFFFFSLHVRMNQDVAKTKLATMHRTSCILPNFFLFLAGAQANPTCQMMSSLTSASSISSINHARQPRPCTKAAKSAAPPRYFVDSDDMARLRRPFLCSVYSPRSPASPEILLRFYFTANDISLTL